MVIGDFVLLLIVLFLLRIGGMYVENSGEWIGDWKRQAMCYGGVKVLGGDDFIGEMDWEDASMREGARNSVRALSLCNQRLRTRVNKIVAYPKRGHCLRHRQRFKAWLLCIVWLRSQVCGVDASLKKRHMTYVKCKGKQVGYQKKSFTRARIRDRHDFRTDFLTPWLATSHLFYRNASTEKMHCKRR